MKLGVVAGALTVERTPEAMRPERLFETAHRSGLHSIHLHALRGGSRLRSGLRATAVELQVITARHGVDFADTYRARRPPRGALRGVRGDVGRPMRL